MKQSHTLEEDQTIEINGAVLTAKAIKQIKMLQESENEPIKGFKDYIAESICFIAKTEANYSGSDKESFKSDAYNLISNLAYCRDYLDELQKTV